MNEKGHIFERDANELYKPFSKDLFKKYGVKRGLRNDDETGVMAGLTAIGQVNGYYMDDGEKPGTLGACQSGG